MAERSGTGFTLALLGAATLLACAATLHADAVGSTERTIAAPLARVVDAALAAASLTAQALARARALRPVAVALLLASLVAWLRAGRRGVAHPVVAALGLALLAQWYALDRQLLAAGVSYACAAALWWLRRAPPERVARRPRAGAELGMLLVPIAAYLALGIHRLDVFPTFYFDEGAYLNAARMQVGTLEPGVVARYGAGTVYDFERFQFQRVPLALQAAALRLLEPGLLALRLASLLAVVAAFVTAALSLRARLDPFSIATMLWLAALSPLCLAYGRAGFYVGASVLHGALCFAAVLQLQRRWDVPSALILGVLLGGSLYFYQLSWFVPVFAALGIALSPEPWRRPGRARVALSVVATASAVALPGLVAMPGGLEQVAAQTFDKATWSPGEGAPVAVVVAPATADDAQASELAASTASDALRAVASFSGARPVVVFFGEPSQLDAGVARAEAAGWEALGSGNEARSVWSRLTGMVARLLYRSDWESSGRWIDGPILNPLVAPLLLLGLVEALRRRRDPTLRLLLVWVVAGALLPAAAGGRFPRRTVLMLPFAYAVAALPLAELARAFANGRGGVRWVEPLLGAWLVAAAVAGVQLYFGAWDQRISLGGPAYRILQFDKLLKELPTGERVFTPRLFGRDWVYLHRADDRTRGPDVIVVREADRPEAIRARSCGVATPFSWAIPDVPEARARFAALEQDFRVDAMVRGRFVLLRALERLPGGCDALPAG